MATVCSNWTQYPERLTREQMIAALECVDNLIADYTRGEDRGGDMDWEDIDATHDAAAAHFPEVVEAQREWIALDNPDGILASQEATS